MCCCSRSGKAVRLTYEHKGADEAEAKRIVKAGGFIVLNRVNGTTHLDTPLTFGGFGRDT
jgi:protein phosphatase PTC1